MGLVLGLLLLSVQPVLAYTYTLASSGLVVHWKGQPYLPLVGNPKNLSRLTDQAVSSAVIRGLTRWKEASGGATSFDYWQGLDNSIFEPSPDFNGLSSFYFASNAKSGDKLPSNVIGLTQVWYNADSGEILEADITLNDIHYQFTTNPRDTSGNGLNANGNGRNVYIENVLTHELGHAFGLSHSGNLQATMLFMEAPEQAHLGCDERIGIHSLYPTSDQSNRGTIRGKVVAGPGSQGVFGAQVVAISRNRGTVMVTGITDRRGEYVLNALEEGVYFIFVEPFFGGADVLPSYYSGVNPRICDGGSNSFGRTMLMDTVTNRLLPIHANGGGELVVPDLLVQCSENGGAAVQATRNSERFSSAVTINDDAGAGGFGIIDRFTESSFGFNTLHYKLKNIEGRLDVHAMAYSLYSPANPSLTLLDSVGREVMAVGSSQDVFIGESGFVNYDSALSAQSLPFGDYYIVVSASRLDSWLYPVGAVSLDSVPFVAVVGSVNARDPALMESLPLNARCKSDGELPPYSSPPGAPLRKSTNSSSEARERDFLGFCGAISNISNPPPGSAGSGTGGSPSAAAMVGWSLSWILILFAWLFPRLRVFVSTAKL